MKPEPAPLHYCKMCNSYEPGLNEDNTTGVHGGHLAGLVWHVADSLLFHGETNVASQCEPDLDTVNRRLMTLVPFPLHWGQ